MTAGSSEPYTGTRDAKGNEYQNHYFMDRQLKEPLQQAAIDEYNAKNQMGGQGGGYSGGGGYGGPQGAAPETPYGNPPVGDDDDIPF